MKSEKILYACNALTSRIYAAVVGNPSKVNADEIKSIVCVKWDEIGDMVAALHVFDSLKNRFPKAELIVVCKPFVGSLLKGNPSIDRVIHGSIPKLKADIWIELRGTWLTWWKSLFSGSKYRLDRGTIRYLQRGNQPHETITNFRIIQPLLNNAPMGRGQIFLTESELEEGMEILKKLGASADAKLCLIHPGGRSILRRWPVDRFQNVMELLHQKGYTCVVFGSVEERELLNEFQQLKPSTLIWETKESLRVFYGVMQRAQLFIGNESGPLQLADLAGVPALGLFGPGVKNVFYPQGQNSLVIHKVLACNPCDQIHCHRFHDRCMLQISASEVTDAVLTLVK